MMADKIIFWVMQLLLLIFIVPIIVFDPQSKGFVIDINWFKCTLFIPYIVMTMMG